MAASLVLGLLAAGLGTAAVAQSRALARREAALAARWHRALVQHADRRRALERVQTAAEVQSVAEAAVETTTATVQKVHQGIAAIPFALLEALPPTRAPARLARAVHDLTANTIYSGITEANRLLGRVLRGAGAKPALPPIDKEPPKK